MRITRIKCHNLIKSNRNSINMDTIATIIKNTVLSLIYYAGNVWMNQQFKINPVRTEYHRCIKYLCPNIPRLSVDAVINFMGSHILNLSMIT